LAEEHQEHVIESAEAVELTRYDMVFVASLAQRAGRNDDATNVMLCVANQTDKNLSCKERTVLFSSAAKTVERHRQALSMLSEQLDQDSSDKERKCVCAFMRKICDELYIFLSALIGIVQRHLTCATDPSARVFYQKWRGDTFRYLCDWQHQQHWLDQETMHLETGFMHSSSEQGLLNLDKYKDQALAAFTTATEEGRAELGPQHPLLLDLALNFGTFCFDHLHDPEQALSITKRATDDAMAEIRLAKSQTERISNLCHVLALVRLLQAKSSEW
jgi:hypothetical protein